MDVNALLLALLIGAVAGWFAGQLLQGTGFGLLGDIFAGKRPKVALDVSCAFQ